MFSLKQVTQIREVNTIQRKLNYLLMEEQFQIPIMMCLGVLVALEKSIFSFRLIINKI